MGVSFFYQWEVDLMVAIQAHFGHFMVLVSQFLSLLGQEYPLVLLVCILYFSSNKKLGKRICINLMTVLVWVPMIKNVAFRRRPYFDHEEIKILLAPVPTEDPMDMVAQGFSFPSAHSACSIAAYPTLFNASKKKWVKPIGLIIAILVGISRFCVGAHYPTDVLVGWLIGIIVALLLPFLYEHIKNDNIVNFIVLATAIPGMFYCKTTDYYSGFGLFLGACFAFMVEEKYVKFKETNKIGRIIIRVICGLAVFLALAEGLKLVIGTGIVARVIRYAIAAFVAMGVYPILFKKFEKE